MDANGACNLASTAATDGQVARLAADAPAMTAALVVVAVGAPLAVLAAVDLAMLDGEPVWLKPLRFSVSLAVYLATPA